MSTAIVALLAYGAGAIYKHDWNPLHWFKPKNAADSVKVLSAVEGGKTYALNVIAKAGSSADSVAGAITSLAPAASGPLFSSVGKTPQLARSGITAFPGMDLSQNYAGVADQWIVYVKALDAVKLPLQMAPTLTVTSAIVAQ